MSEKLISLKSILGKDFPEHICEFDSNKKRTDKQFLIKILTDRKPFIMILYRYFNNPRLIRYGETPKYADEKFKEFNKKHGNPLTFEKKSDGDIEAIYDCLTVKYCPFCGEKLYYTSRKKYLRKLLPKTKNPRLVIIHKIIDFDSIKNNHSKLCSLCYRINSKQHRHNDVDYKLWLDGLPKYPDYDCYRVIKYILTMSNPYYIYLPRTWNVCVEYDGKSYFFRDMLPSVWYQSDRRHIMFGKPIGAN